MNKIPHNKGKDNRKKFNCINCNKEIKDYRFRKFCSKSCASIFRFKGQSKKPESIRKMVDTRKKLGSYKWSEESKQKISQSLKGRIFTKEHKEKLSKSLKGKLKSEETKKIFKERPLHTKYVKEEINNLKLQGFRVIDIDRGIRPDLIAIKNNKIFAVEIELNHPNYNKYTNNLDYDDVIWILKKKEIKNGKM